MSSSPSDSESGSLARMKTNDAKRKRWEEDVLSLQDHQPRTSSLSSSTGSSRRLITGKSIPSSTAAVASGENNPVPKTEDKTSSDSSSEGEEDDFILLTPRTAGISCPFPRPENNPNEENPLHSIKKARKKALVSSDWWKDSLKQDDGDEDDVEEELAALYKRPSAPNEHSHSSTQGNGNSSPSSSSSSASRDCKLPSSFLKPRTTSFLQGSYPLDDLFWEGESYLGGNLSDFFCTTNDPHHDTQQDASSSSSDSYYYCS